MIDQVNQQVKSNPKWGVIASLILGIISMIPVAIIELMSRLAPVMWLSTINISAIFFIIAPLIALIGLILGIRALKSTKRNFAISGIILCIIGLLVPLYYFLFQ